MKTPCSYEGCTENTENGEKYCFTHSCLFCDNAIKDGTHYCTEHICKYKEEFAEHFCNTPKPTPQEESFSVYPLFRKSPRGKSIVFSIPFIYLKNML